jgi:hypothetical protein
MVAGGPPITWCFYSSGGWESVGPRRVTCCGGAYLMLRFRLEREDDEMKRC